MRKKPQSAQTATPPESGARRRWRSLIQQQQQSNLSQAEFCRRHGLRAQSFSAYKRLLGFASAAPRRRAPTPAPPALPPAPAPAQPSPTVVAVAAPPFPTSAAPAAPRRPAAAPRIAPVAAPAFLPLRVRSAPKPRSLPPPSPQRPADASWIEVVLDNGRRLRAPPSVDGGDLQRLVVALEGGP